MPATAKEQDVRIVVPGGELEPKTIRLHEETWWLIDHLAADLIEQVGREFSLGETIEHCLQVVAEEWAAKHPQLKWKPSSKGKK